VATNETGQAFLRECRRLGCRVLLLTEASLHDADWPHEAIDAMFYAPHRLSWSGDLRFGDGRFQAIEQIGGVRQVMDALERNRTSRNDLLKGVSAVARTEMIDRIVLLDDPDVDLAALLREHLCLPSMGEPTARCFRDRLALRVQARDRGLRVPRFMHVLNHDAIRRFADEVPPPWFLKPRSRAPVMRFWRVEDAATLP